MEQEKKKARPLLRISGIVLDCSDAEALAGFYRKLLGWKQTHSGNGWAGLESPDGAITLAFQEVENYLPPVWPWEKGKQGQMLHLDFMTEELEKAVQYALECGATLAEAQYFASSRTMFDPDGHPFCLDTKD